MFVVKPEEVQNLWDHDDPCIYCQELLQEFLVVYKEQKGKDINKYDENEKRYEPKMELKWLADYLVNALVLLKHELNMENNDAVAEALQVFWDSLDFLNINEEMEGGGKAVNSRFMIMQNGVSDLFKTQRINRSQAMKIIEYTRRTLFMHL